MSSSGGTPAGDPAPAAGASGINTAAGPSGSRRSNNGGGTDTAATADAGGGSSAGGEALTGGGTSSGGGGGGSSGGGGGAEVVEVPIDGGLNTLRTRRNSYSKGASATKGSSPLG